MGALYDADIREPLFDFLEEHFGSVRILEEKNIGKARTDVMMVMENALCGLEIKSDADSYARLAGQVKEYDKYFDYNYVVVGTRHAMHIEEHVPPYWGIFTVEKVEGLLDIYRMRKAAVNPHMRLEKKLELLWKPELAIIQNKYAMPKYKDKKKAFVIDKIMVRTEIPQNQKGHIAKESIHRNISEILMERDYTKAKEMLQEYRKGEIAKQLESETDPQRRLELMVLQAEKGKLLTKNNFRRRRRKRK